MSKTAKRIWLALLLLVCGLGGLAGLAVVVGGFQRNPWFTMLSLASWGCIFWLISRYESPISAFFSRRRRPRGAHDDDDGEEGLGVPADLLPPIRPIVASARKEPPE